LNARSSRPSSGLTWSGKERSSPVKIGRRPAARRRRKSVSFETPTNGEASTDTSAWSS
jgi:hypothetical protein